MWLRIVPSLQFQDHCLVKFWKEPLVQLVFSVASVTTLTTGLLCSNYPHHLSHFLGSTSLKELRFLCKKIWGRVLSPGSYQDSTLDWLPNSKHPHSHKKNPSWVEQANSVFEGLWSSSYITDITLISFSLVLEKPVFPSSLQYKFGFS